MLNSSMNESDLSVIKGFLDGIFYPYFGDQIDFQEASLFPDFLKNHAKTLLMNRPFAFYNSLFRLGHTVDGAFVSKYIPKNVFDLLITSGLLVSENGEWRTPGLSIICLNGVYFFVPIPAYYPTSTVDYPWLDLKTAKMSIGLIPRGANRILEVSEFGTVSMISGFFGNRQCDVLTTSDLAQNLISFSAKFNQISSKVVAVQNSSEVPINSYDFAFVSPAFLNNSPIKSPGRIPELKTQLEIVEKIKLSDMGQTVLIFDTIGLKKEIPEMKTIAEKIRSECGLFSQILVVDKWPLEAYFQKVFTESLSNWHTLAGYKPSYYARIRNEWLKDVGINETALGSYIYRVIWRLTITEPLFIFDTAYQPANYDPLYAMSKISYV